MLDRLTSMAVFVRTAEAGSFAAVAEPLGMSPQMVAKHVAALERHLGTRLIRRTTRRQSLTEFGRLYYDRCQAILTDVEAIERMAQATQLEARGRLRLNAPVTFGRYTLMPLITGFLRTYPAVEVDIVLSDRLVDPVDEGFEAVLRIGALDPQLALVARALQPYRLLACASPNYLTRNGTPSVPTDLEGHECVGFSPWPSAFNRHWRFVREGVEYQVEVGSRLNLNDWAAMHAAALDGFGIVLGYERALTADLAAGRLVRVLADFEVPSRPMHLLYAPDRRMTQKLRCFVDWMLGELGQDAPTGIA